MRTKDGARRHFRKVLRVSDLFGSALRQLLGLAKHTYIVSPAYRLVHGLARVPYNAERVLTD